jgi:hypothetical protein
MRFPDLLKIVIDMDEQLHAHDEVITRLLRGEALETLREEYLDGLAQAPGEQVRRKDVGPPKEIDLG